MSGWRKKERELTIDEAMRLAKIEALPYWFNSPPLIGGVKMGNASSVYPLHDKFKQSPWLIYFLDVTDLNGEATIYHLKQWSTRYSPFGLASLIVLRLIYDQLKEPLVLKKWVERHQIPFPIAFDFDGTLASAFGVEQFPAVVLCSQSSNGAVVHRASGENWPQGYESHIQTFLRSNDPGLALTPVKVVENHLPKDFSRLEFGKNRGTRFMTKEPLESELATSVIAQGEWNQTADGVTTIDQTATLSFMTEAGGFSFVGETLSKKNPELGKMIIELDGAAVIDAFASPDLTYDDTGQSAVYFKEFQLYHAVRGLKEGRKRFTLKFPNSKRVKVALYGVRLLKPAV